MKSIKFAANLAALILMAYFFAGCATPNISKAAKIDEREGMLLTKVHSNVKMLKVFIMEEGKNNYVAEIFAPDENLRIIPIKNGKASFGRIVRYGLVLNYYSGLQPFYFDIEPGSITYVGDLFINWISTDIIGGGRAQVRIADNEEETVAEAKGQYPWLFERYRYRKNLPFKTNDGFQEFIETEEIKDLIDRIR